MENKDLTSSSFMSFIQLNHTLPAESTNVDTQHNPPSVCLYSWVQGWFNSADSSTRRGWHQWESWTDGVVSPRCSKSQLAWCLDQWQSFPWFFLCGFRLWTQGHLFIEVPGRLGPQKLSVQCGPHEEKKICFRLYNLKCPSSQVRCAVSFNFAQYRIKSDYIIRKPWMAFRLYNRN